MIASTVLILSVMSCSGHGEPLADTVVGFVSARDVEFDEIVLLDRLHQTFLVLNQVAMPAYREHFSDESDKLAVVEYYADRLAAVLGRESYNRQDLARVDRSTGADNERAGWMRLALAELEAGNVERAEQYLTALGAEPHAELRRVDPSMPGSAARCPLYDPELLLAHRQLRQLKTGRSAPALPSNLAQSLNEQHAAIRSLREQADNHELSMRKFLDKYRPRIWDLGWLYRCRGIELASDPDAARICFLRAWAIGEALFPASERGRVDRFDPVFLAELGDIYARLGRYDLMLRYLYCDEGLPARHEMARPVAELARVTESVRLVQADRASELPIEKQLPETVSQILFEQPVATQPSSVATRGTPPPEHATKKVGWILLSIGACLVCGTIAWRLVRLTRRPMQSANGGREPPGV